MRDKDLDIYRGCVMIYVICFTHQLFWLKFFSMPVKSFFIFSMPVVFYLAGASFSLASPKPYMAYVRKRFMRIVPPYWLYAFCVLSFLFLIGFLSDPKYLPSGRDVVQWIFFSGVSPLPYLSDHLWFIPPYLCISLMAPLLYRLWVKLKIPAVFLCLFFPAVLLVLDLFNIEAGLLRDVLTYSLFFILGFSYKKIYFPVRQQVIAAILLFTALLYCHLYGGYSLDMQANKFPPNLMFSLYNLFILIAFGRGLAFVCRKLYKGYLKGVIDAFNKYGYTIYLYQSFPYLFIYKISKGLGVQYDFLPAYMHALLLPLFFIFLLCTTGFLGFLMTKAGKFLFEKRVANAGELS
ncbi:MAG: acyltransferase [Bacteroidales bacterium]|nr:acyltransferase [Bacteroidales bacterium]